MVLAASVGGILALIFWGLSDYFSGKSGKEKETPLSNLIIQFVATGSLLPLIFWYGLPIGGNIIVLKIAGIATLFTVAYLSYIRALTIGPVGVASPLANSYALVTLLIALTFFNLQLTNLHLLALLTVIVGVVLLGVDRTTFIRKRLNESTIYYSAIATFLWGIGFALLDTIVGFINWYHLLLLLALFISIYSLFYYLVTYKALPSWKNLNYSSSSYAWKAGSLLTVGSIAFFIAIERTGSVVIPAVISSASPLITSFMAYYRDNEKLSKYKRIGAIVIVVGLMLLNI